MGVVDPANSSVGDAGHVLAPQEGDSHQLSTPILPGTVIPLCLQVPAFWLCDARNQAASHTATKLPTTSHEKGKDKHASDCWTHHQGELAGEWDAVAPNLLRLGSLPQGVTNKEPPGLLTAHRARAQGTSGIHGCRTLGPSLVLTGGEASIPGSARGTCWARSGA